MIMWESDCGALPVVSHEKQVVGMITDRDICMAAATKHRLASDIAVGEVASRAVYACSPDDDVKEALKTMEKERLRRLPALDTDGVLQGMLSMNDVVLHAEQGTKGRKTPTLSYKDAISALKEICAPRTLVGFSLRRNVSGCFTLFRHIEAVNNFNTCARLARVEQATRA